MRTKTTMASKTAPSRPKMIHPIMNATTDPSPSAPPVHLNCHCSLLQTIRLFLLVYIVDVPASRSLSSHSLRATSGLVDSSEEGLIFFLEKYFPEMFATSGDEAR